MGNVRRARHSDGGSEVSISEPVPWLERWYRHFALFTNWPKLCRNLLGSATEAVANTGLRLWRVASQRRGRPTSAAHSVLRCAVKRFMATLEEARRCGWELCELCGMFG